MPDSGGSMILQYCERYLIWYRESSFRRMFRLEAGPGHVEKKALL